jgi:hypothetical protein
LAKESVTATAPAKQGDYISLWVQENQSKKNSVVSWPWRYTKAGPQGMRHNATGPDFGTHTSLFKGTNLPNYLIQIRSRVRVRTPFCISRGFYLSSHPQHQSNLSPPPSIAQPSWASLVRNFLHGSMSCSRSTIPGSSNAGPARSTAKSLTPSIVRPSVSIGLFQRLS